MQYTKLMLICLLMLVGYGCGGDDNSADAVPLPDHDDDIVNSRDCGYTEDDLTDLEQAASYILYTPITSTSTYLMSEEGSVEYSWSSDYAPGLASYLTSEGYLLRAGHDTEGITSAWGEDLTNYYGGIIQSSYIDKATGETLIDWEFNFVDDLDANYAEQLPHHDFHIMPNCNILLLVQEVKSVSEAENAGRDPDYMEDLTYVLSGQIVEIARTEHDDGSDSWEIVWQWNVWDHLIQDQNSTLTDTYNEDINNNIRKIDINYYSSNAEYILAEDIFHLNDVFYIEEYDQILVSSYLFSEVWVIDHSLTTEEAATDAGDLLYRWGNASAYGYTGEGYVFLSGVHNATLYKDSSASNGFGTFLMYGNNNFGDYSQVVEMTPDFDVVTGRYHQSQVTDPETGTNYNVFGPNSTNLLADIYSEELNIAVTEIYFGSVQKLPTGGYLTCDCAGTGNAIWMNDAGTVTSVLDLASASEDQDAADTFRVHQYWSSQAAVMNIEK